MSMANRIVMVTGLGQAAGVKLLRYLDYMRAVEEIKKVDIVSKLQIYVNRTLKMYISLLRHPNPHFHCIFFLLPLYFFLFLLPPIPLWIQGFRTAPV